MTRVWDWKGLTGLRRLEAEALSRSLDLEINKKSALRRGIIYPNLHLKRIFLASMVRNSVEESKTGDRNISKELTVRN